MLKGKTVLLGITGGIAAYKAAYLASALVKLHASVEVIMTDHATKFITPLTFEQLTGNTREAFLLFDDTRRREMGVYYYGSTANEVYYSHDREYSPGFEVRNELVRDVGKGYAVTNHILRDIRPAAHAEPFRVNGDLCLNILSV